MHAATKKATETITVQALNDLLNVAKLIARESIGEYKLLVTNVLDAAFSRDTYNKLVECECFCFAVRKSALNKKSAHHLTT